MIADNVINWFMWSIWQNPIYTFKNKIGMELIQIWLLFNNVISFPEPQRDQIKHFHSLKLIVKSSLT